MKIRPAARGDYEQVSALFAQVDALHREASPDVFRGVAGPARTIEWLEARIASDELALLVADDAGDLLGVVEVVDSAPPSSPLLEPRRYAVVEGLVVRDDQQGRGVGRALMEAAHAWASERGLEQVQLHVWEFNAEARSFYEALGYQTLSRKLGRRLG